MCGQGTCPSAGASKTTEAGRHERREQLQQLRHVERHFFLIKYTVVRGKLSTRLGGPYYLYTVVLFDISKGLDILDSDELFPDRDRPVSQIPMRRRCENEWEGWRQGKAYRRNRDRSVNSSRRSTYIGNDAPACNLAQLADTVKVVFTISVYKATVK